MFIVGYEITAEVDQGDAWVNAVDPKTVNYIAHKECAWNHEDLSLYSDPHELRKITPAEAQEKHLVCGYCEMPLTEKRWFAFQASLILLEVA